MFSLVLRGAVLSLVFSQIGVEAWLIFGCFSGIVSQVIVVRESGQERQAGVLVHAVVVHESLWKLE